jgi:hypothetical protein
MIDWKIWPPFCPVYPEEANLSPEFCDICCCIDQPNITKMTNKLKSVFALVLLLFVSVFATAQNKVEWKEMLEFHKVMSQTFHPVEEGNFQPIRERIGEMVQNAKAWQHSAIPAGYSNVKGIQKNLKKLVKKSSALDAKIKANCSDEVILTDLTLLHDIFHDIIGLCHDEH